MPVSQAIFSALLLSIIAAAGLVKGVDLAWVCAGITAALAFFSIEARNHAMVRASDSLMRCSNILTLLSWLTGAIGSVALLV